MKNVLLNGVLSLAVVAGAAMPAAAQRRDRPSTALQYAGRNAATTAGDGYLVGGDLWNTFKPANTTEGTRLGSPFAPVGGGIVNRVLFGSRANWQEPTGLWPSGFNFTNSFRNSGFMVFPVFKSTGWPGYGPGNAVRALDGSADTRGTGGTSRFMFASFGPNVPGATDAARNYKRPAHYTDESRTELIYEAGWPTTAGIDFKVRARQYTPNTQNLNDFTVLEISMTNTGIVDTNGDGTPDATGNVVDGVSMGLDVTASPSIEISTGGDRGCNCIAAGRTFGYVGAPDATGAPYNLWAWYANVPPTQTAGRTVPAVGRRAFGINNLNQLQGYTDVWNSMSFLGAKQGAISDSNLRLISSVSPDKSTAFGTHPVGTGPQRGWYTSVQWQAGLASLSNSALAFRNSTATWYADYGKTSNGGSRPVNLAPNPAFFSGGSADDITTFTVGNAGARPNGDFKYANQDLGVANVELAQPVWEPAWNPGAASGDFYNGTVGFAREYTFGEAETQGIGPFRLGVGESMTIVWVAAAGFRLEGIADAVDAARWAWGTGWDVSTRLPVPAAPDLTIESTTTGTALVRWTDVNNVAGRPIDGYKVWRSAQYRRTNWLDAGMRLQDRYQEQHDPGPFPATLLDPVNPNFDGLSIFQGGIQGSYQPAEWGTYELLAKIPLSALGTYTNPSGGYQFAFEDTDSITGFTYWYYVSAYRDGAFVGPRGPVGGGHIESSNMNRNGRNAPDATPGQIGLGTQWGGTYPFAISSAFFPRAGTVALNNIGAAFTVVPPVALPDQVADLITVSPNPYKITGLNDVRNDPASHSVNFLNVPADFTLTIVDVSGKLVYQRVVEGGANGRFSWDLFSKDGVEVSSGLYLYHIQYGDRNVTGHFAILR